MFPRIGFRLKLIGSYIAIILISFGFIAFFLARNLEEMTVRDIKASLTDDARLIRSQITASDIKHARKETLQSLAKMLGEEGHRRVTVIDRQGTVLADSERTPEGVTAMENHLDRPEVRAALAGGTGVDTHRSATLKTDMLYVAVPVPAAGAPAGALRLAIPLTQVESMRAEVRRTVLAGLLFAIILAIVIGSVLAGQIVRPINRMIAISREFAKGDLSRRMIHDSQDEIGELAATLNRMAGDIEEMLRKIASQNQKLAAVFTSMIEGVIVVDHQGVILSINPAIEKIFGVSAQETRGKLFLAAIRNNEIGDIIARVLDEGKVISREISLIVPEQRTFLINAAPVFEHTTVSGCLIVIHDITEMRRLETLRRDFVANVSHELKTPLTSIRGFAETLLEGALDDRKNNRAFLTIIQEHAERLNSLVNDLLSLAHLESKEATVSKHPVDLRHELDKVLQGFSAQIARKKITIRNELPARLTVHADTPRITQVFTNLLDNAIKYNREGGTVTISSRTDAGRVTIRVEDTGPGIPAKDLPRIFERFYRVDKARSRDLGGTGLGLSIVKHIIELHGGTVSVESVEGSGSRFSFTLPL